VTALSVRAYNGSLLRPAIVAAVVCVLSLVGFTCLVGFGMAISTARNGEFSWFYPVLSIVALVSGFSFFALIALAVVALMRWFAGRRDVQRIGL
jgi:hypothetical protein